MPAVVDFPGAEDALLGAAPGAETGAAPPELAPELRRVVHVPVRAAHEEGRPQVRRGNLVGDAPVPAALVERLARLRVPPDALAEEALAGLQAVLADERGDSLVGAREPEPLRQVGLHLRLRRRLRCGFR